jgi:hypothetical protein
MRAIPLLCLAASLTATVTDPRPLVAAEAPEQLARRIDRRLETMWENAKVKPAALADDAEFLRRVYLDLAGRIPAPDEAREFLDDRRPDKRARLIDELLDGTDHRTHFARTLRIILSPTADPLGRETETLQEWLRPHVIKNTGYDQIAREIVGYQVFRTDKRSRNGPSSFYFALNSRPENLAAATARIFLGIRIECAQCHDHPFAPWKQEQFWQFAAFFSGLVPSAEVPYPTKDDPKAREIAIPNKGKIVPARFPDGNEPEWKEGVATRQILADWMTSPSNPYFARTAVNRMWAVFFGAGLVEPVDDTADAKADPAALLDELAKAFAESKFDLKHLIRAITLTRAYQLSGRAAGAPATPRAFERMALRGLTPDQLLDSVTLATGWSVHDAGTRDRFRRQFALDGVGMRDRATSIQQGLALMNGEFVTTAVTDGQTLARLLVDDKLGTEGRVEELYLATLSRRPTARELARAVKFVESRFADSKDDVSKRNREAYGDFLWALINTPEFCLNH